jgi:glycosyltransferase involved in cell wall biosynthesis
MISVRADHGGGPKHLFQLIFHLNERFNLFAACPNEAPYWGKYKNILGASKIIEIPHRKFKFSKLHALRKFISQNNIDIIHSHGKGAGIYSRLLSIITKVKCVHTFHGLHIDNYNTPLKIFYITLERIFARFTDKFISVSNSEAERLLKKLKLNKSKLLLIENGIDIPDKPAFPTGGGKSSVLTITRFDYAKNTLLLAEIIRALKELGSLDKFSFKVIGEGEERKQFEKSIENYSLANSVELLNFSENIEEHYRETFCYISTSRWEGLPLTILEAMSYGIPVIATDVVGNKDLVQQGETGFLFDLNSPKSAAEHLIELAENNSLKSIISKNCLKLVIDKYNVNIMTSKTETLYNTL